MELRDSGRDLVQIEDDGTHVILPATAHPVVRLDCAELPVMMLRHAMERCAEMQSTPSECSDVVPSLSEGCTARKGKARPAGVLIVVVGVEVKETSRKGACWRFGQGLERFPMSRAPAAPSSSVASDP
jgi:hypothetical protein